MKIENIRLKNFKAFKEVEIRDISNFAVFVGANGTGKSTLFEANDKIDAGQFYLKDEITLLGTELYNEIRMNLDNKIIEMCLYYVQNYTSLKPQDQIGEESIYRKRNFSDDEIDPNKSISSQFNQFRICDNENFPIWFEYLGKKYILKIWEM